MDSLEIIEKWQIKILEICEQKLQRADSERKFVRSRGVFAALEMIEESVAAMSSRELEAYLNSEIAS